MWTVRLLTTTMEPGPHTSPSLVITTIRSHYVSMLVMMTGVATSQTVTLPSVVRKQFPDTDTAAARPRRDIDPHNLLSWSWSHGGQVRSCVKIGEFLGNGST